jgi:tRNA A37 threonylcarbamoyladenosine synthetase subunit TsaC/SUA5/YrdC
MSNSIVEQKIRNLIKSRSKKFVRLIASFKMLESLATVSKLQYDFLTGYGQGSYSYCSSTAKYRQEIALRYPKTKFVHEIIERTGLPLIAVNIMHIAKFSPAAGYNQQFSEKG